MAPSPLPSLSASRWPFIDGFWFTAAINETLITTMFRYIPHCLQRALTAYYCGSSYAVFLFFIPIFKVPCPRWGGGGFKISSGPTYFWWNGYQFSSGLRCGGKKFISKVGACNEDGGLSALRFSKGAKTRSIGPSSRRGGYWKTLRSYLSDVSGLISLHVGCLNYFKYKFIGNKWRISSAASKNSWASQKTSSLPFEFR